MTKRVDWTDTLDTALTSLWATGQTAETIAGQLGGEVTKSSVIGRANRLGLPARRRGAKGRPRPRAGISMIDRFAEAMAATAGTRHDGDVRFVGRSLGLTPVQAHSTMQNLRRMMGAQAV